MKKLVVILAVAAVILAVALPVVAQDSSNAPAGVTTAYSASASAPGVQYDQYSAGDQYNQYGTGILPDTGGPSLGALWGVGAGVLLIVGGLLARKIVR